MQWRDLLVHHGCGDEAMLTLSPNVKCFAVFSEDGHQYPAVIQQVDLVAQLCFVTYPDYGNSVSLQRLMNQEWVSFAACTPE